LWIAATGQKRSQQPQPVQRTVISLRSSCTTMAMTGHTDAQPAQQVQRDGSMM
jgi:hypothetical protein